MSIAGQARAQQKSPTYVRLGVIFDRPGQSCLAVDVRFAPEATELPRGHGRDGPQNRPRASATMDAPEGRLLNQLVRAGK
jgi:hypothetical protein